MYAKISRIAAICNICYLIFYYGKNFLKKMVPFLNGTITTLAYVAVFVNLICIIYYGLRQKELMASLTLQKQMRYIRFFNIGCMLLMVINTFMDNFFDGFYLD